MGHAVHFLQRIERLSSTQADLALALYRDPGLVRFILSEARLAENTERVAIALEQRPDSPWIIVTSDGRFVTCLSAGMQVSNCAILTRSQLDRLSETRSDIRDTLERLSEGGRGEIRRLMHALLHSGNRLTREDFRTLVIFFPLVLKGTLTTAINKAVSTEEFRERYSRGRYARLGRAARSELREYWEEVWALSHVLAICSYHDDCLGHWISVGDNDLYADFVHAMFEACTRSLSTAITMRAIRVAACHGRPLLTRCQRAMYEADNIVGIYSNAVALGAIGIRHSGLRAEVQEILTDHVAQADELYSSESMRKAVKVCLETMLVYMDNPIDKLHEMHRKLGADMVSRVASRGCFEDKAMRDLKNEEVPAEVAMAWPLLVDSWLYTKIQHLVGSISLVPWLATASPEELYLPASQGRYNPPWHGELLLAQLDHYSKHMAGNTTVRAEPQPGRNQPCPCGSGKKYKRCCGAG